MRGFLTEKRWQLVVALALAAIGGFLEALLEAISAGTIAIPGEWGVLATIAVAMIAREVASYRETQKIRAELAPPTSIEAYPFPRDPYHGLWQSEPRALTEAEVLDVVHRALVSAGVSPRPPDPRPPAP